MGWIGDRINYALDWLVSKGILEEQAPIRTMSDRERERAAALQNRKEQKGKAKDAGDWTAESMIDAMNADTDYLLEAWKRFPAKGKQGVDITRLVAAVNAKSYPAPKRA